MKYLILVALCATITQVYSGHVLFLYPNASPSHKNIGVPIMRGLAERGHNVTVVSTFKTEPHPNIRDILPFRNFDYFPNLSAMDLRRRGIWNFVLVDWSPMYEGCRKTYEYPEFQALLNQTVDLVLMDAFANECLLGFVHKLGAPYIIVSPLPVPGFVSERMGNRMPPSFVPSFSSHFNQRMSLTQRVTNLVFSLLMEYGLTLPFETHESIYREYLGPDTPPLNDILYNASLLLSNSHFSFNFPRPTLPDVVEIGAVHCRPGRPLPKDLDSFLSGAKDGFILFSLGSIVKPHELPEETRKVFVNVFSRLKQRVLWKWPLEMSDLPSNVKLLKWIPQQDVLAHPNIRLFITHGGLLSTQESIYHGVPMVDIPVFGDQDLNAFLASEAGIAVTVEILDITEEKLETAINEVLNNKDYKERVKKLSSYILDQPDTPKERAVFWAEYVMRHKGARHMRSAARELNFFQYYCLDVAAVILLVLSLILGSSFVVLRSVLRYVGILGTPDDAKQKKLQ